AHELRLFMRRDLVVHPAQRAAALVVRNARLRDASFEAAARELLRVERPREETANVPMRLELDHERAADRRLREDHASTSTRGIGTTNFPPHSRMCAICSVISSRRFHGRIRT